MAIDEILVISELDRDNEEYIRMDIDGFSVQNKIQDTDMHEEEDAEIYKEEYPQDINEFEPNCTPLSIELHW